MATLPPRTAAPWIAALGCALLACSARPATEVVLEFDTDLPVPAQLNGLRVVVQGGDGARHFESTYRLGREADQIMLPRRLTVVPRDDGNPTFTVDVDGMFDATVVVSQRATLGFVTGRSLFLRMELMAVCRNRTCDPSSTCVRGDCVPTRRNAAALPDFHRGQAYGTFGVGGAGGGGPGGSGGGEDGRDGSADAPTGSHDGPAAGPDAPATDRIPGAACTAASQCASGHCVDGVCCDLACDGLCSACNLAGKVGRCSLVADGMDPREVCATEPASSCGRDGSCDGKGACRRYGAGTECRATSCTGSTRTLASTCDGSGACVAGQTQSCAPYLCGASGQCLDRCEGDQHCVSPSRCNANSCGKKPLGGSCDTNGDCDSNICQQNVCCDMACTGVCRSCAVTGRRGSCAPVPAGTDPLDHCAPGASCGGDGLCDGMGGCRVQSAGTPCAPAQCANGVSTPERTCDGSGTCRNVQGSSCAPHLCGATACRTTCVGDGDCVPTAFCNGMTCASKKANGAACGRAAECTSNQCADGVCCDMACSGRCMACNLTGQVGRCSPAAPATDPRNDCGDDGAASCRQDGTCDGAGACRFYATGTMCAPAMCSSGTAVSARTCDGSGTCRAGTATSCGAYACNTSGGCRTTCSSPSHCAANHTCTAGACVPVAEVCDNGVDDDGDNQIDCADSQCTTHVCAPNAPAGWTGPVAVRDDVTSANPACAGPYLNNPWKGGRQVTCPAHTCGTCTCGAPPGVGCTTPTVTHWGQNDVTCTGKPITSFPAPGCQAVDGHFMTDGTTPTGPGSCTGQRGPDNKPAPTFARTGLACSGATAGGGCAGGQCLPVPGAPLEGKLCVYRAGDHPCPAGYTANRRVYHQDITDGRTCTTCTCGPPECKGRIWMGQDFSCPTDDGTGLPVPVAMCTHIGGIRAEYIAYVPLGLSCTPSDSMEGGSCTPDAPTATTICCLP
jgi:hypothetical protein